MSVMPYLHVILLGMWLHLKTQDRSYYNLQRTGRHPEVKDASQFISNLLWMGLQSTSPTCCKQSWIEDLMRIPHPYIGLVVVNLQDGSQQVCNCFAVRAFPGYFVTHHSYFFFHKSIARKLGGSLKMALHYAYRYLNGP